MDAVTIVPSASVELPLLSGPTATCHIAANSTSIYIGTNADIQAAVVSKETLEAHKISATFHDYKASGIDKATLEGWVKKVGWEVLLNRAGTTFRKLPDNDKEHLTAKKAIALMLAQPSLIKRPVLEAKGKLLVGFKPEQYEPALVKD